MVQQAVVLTEVDGGVGSAICAAFTAVVWLLAPADIQARSTAVHDAYVNADLARIGSDAEVRKTLIEELGASVGDRSLGALTSNAALY